MTRFLPSACLGWVVAFAIIAALTIKAATPADEAWEKLKAAKKEFGSLKPGSVQGNDFKQFLTVYSKKAGELADQFKKFEESYPTSPHAAKAWESWMDYLNLAAHGSPARKAQLVKAENQELAKPQPGKVRRENIRNNQIERTEDIKECERMVRAFKNEATNPDGFFCFHMLRVAEWSDFPHSKEVVEEILQITNGKQRYQNYEERARELKQRLDRIGLPLDLKFKSLDGNEIDLQKYRGKVVLLDFWATWCPPCVAGLPEVNEVRNKLGKQGFEAIGISYDTERATLENFLKKNKLSWPQYFDPEGKDSALVKSFDSPGPPSYWLIDSHGILVDVNASRDLEKKVRKLLGNRAVTP